MSALIEERCPHLFAALPVFVSRRHVDEMAAIIEAVEEVVALPGYREAALAQAPVIARHDPGALGGFLGYDFHLGAQGPRLIEINTNAGGALLNAVLARAQRACCAEVEALVSGPVRTESLEEMFFETFASEWRRAGRSGLPQRVAIVDDAPEGQFLYPELLLFAQLFRRFGVNAEVVAAEKLAFEGGVLRDARGPLDLVYNRLTDFAFAMPQHAALRAAYLKAFPVRELWPLRMPSFCGRSAAGSSSSPPRATAARPPIAATSSRAACGRKSCRESTSSRS